jgi:hypothetical protein
METLCFSEMLVSTYKSTRRHNPEDQHRHLHRRENLKFHIEFSCLWRVNLPRPHPHPSGTTNWKPSWVRLSEPGKSGWGQTGGHWQVAFLTAFIAPGRTDETWWRWAVRVWPAISVETRRHDCQGAYVRPHFSSPQPQSGFLWSCVFSRWNPSYQFFRNWSYEVDELVKEPHEELPTALISITGRIQGAELCGYIHGVMWSKIKVLLTWVQFGKVKKWQQFGG